MYLSIWLLGRRRQGRDSSLGIPGIQYLVLNRRDAVESSPIWLVDWLMAGELTAGRPASDHSSISFNFQLHVYVYSTSSSSSSFFFFSFSSRSRLIIHVFVVAVVVAVVVALL